MKCNQSHPGFELVSLCPFPTKITITPRTPPHLFDNHLRMFNMFIVFLLYETLSKISKNPILISCFLISMNHFRFWLVVFYGISTLVSYLIPNPVNTKYIFDI